MLLCVPVCFINILGPDLGNSLMLWVQLCSWGYLKCVEIVLGLWSGHNGNWTLMNIKA